MAIREDSGPEFWIGRSGCNRRLASTVAHGGSGRLRPRPSPDASRRGGIGRRNGLKIRWPSGRPGSIPGVGTFIHSYASYHLAHFRNASDLALQLGHQNTEVLFAHYRELVTPEAAARYWEIQPDGGTKLVPMEATG